MPARQIVHEKDGLRAVLREKLGSDVLDAPSIHMVMASHIAKELRIEDPTKIPNRFWGRIVFVTSLMQQTIRLEGDDRFDVPSIDASDEDILDFYKFITGPSISPDVIDFFRDAFKKLDPVPLAIGATSGS
jgi:hypothetical protein